MSTTCRLPASAAYRFRNWMTLSLIHILKYRGRKRELIRYINQHKDYFSNLDQETYRAARVFLNSEKQLKDIAGDEKEAIDMCKALEELYEEGMEKGMEKGLSLIHISWITLYGERS